MKRWLIVPKDKKSIIEYQYWSKGENTILHTVCWRGGEFIVDTQEEMPSFEAGDDICMCGDHYEIRSLYDANYKENDLSECDEQTKEWFENYLEEGNSIIDLENHGWILQDVSYIINCPVDITEYKEDVE